jgi:tetratricopeptide (TPR) repeat protein
VQAGKAANSAGNHQEALGLFDQVLAKCKAGDAKEEGNVGKARALNGLRRHNEAINSADAALKVNKDNLYAFFERGVALHGLGRSQEAQAEFEKVLDLTERNRNTDQKAGIFAYLGEISWKQGLKEQAYQNMAKALLVAPNNPNLFVQRGDMRIHDGMIDEAFADYDRAAALGKADQYMYRARANGLISALQKKYNTTNANELGKRISAAEKSRLCGEIGKAFDMGLRDVQLDLFRTMMCN